jgi:hypothetical protein
MHKEQVIKNILIVLCLSLFGGVFMHMDGLGILAIIASITMFGIIYCISSNPEDGGGPPGGDRVKWAAQKVLADIWDNRMIALFVMSKLPILTKYIQNNIEKLTESQIKKVQEFCESMNIKIPTKGRDITSSPPKDPEPPKPNSPSKPQFRSKL